MKVLYTKFKGLKIFKNVNFYDDYLDNGRMFARCWLMITGVDAYIHPFGSLITNKLFIRESSL